MKIFGEPLYFLRFSDRVWTEKNGKSCRKALAQPVRLEIKSYMPKESNKIKTFFEFDCFLQTANFVKFGFVHSSYRRKLIHYYLTFSLDINFHIFENFDQIKLVIRFTVNNKQFRTLQGCSPSGHSRCKCQKSFFIHCEP